MQQQHTVCDFAGSDSWVILSPIEQSIKRKIEAVGTPLKDWDINIYRGVLTGCNDAFIISTDKRDEILSHTADYVEGQAEDAYSPAGEYARTAALIRPILRGRDIKRYGYNWAGLWLIATFPARHYDIEQYPAVKNYLLSEFGIERLEQTGRTHIVNGEQIKARKKTNNKWFETQDSISYWDDFNQPKIVYPETTQGAYFVYDEKGYFLDKTCFMLIAKTDVMKYLCATLSSHLFEFAYKTIFSSVAIGASGYQYNKHALIKLPILKQKNAVGNDYTDNFFYHLYGLTDEEIAYIEKS